MPDLSDLGRTTAVHTYRLHFEMPNGDPNSVGKCQTNANARRSKESE